MVSKSVLVCMLVFLALAIFQVKANPGTYVRYAHHHVVPVARYIVSHDHDHHDHHAHVDYHPEHYHVYDHHDHHF